MNKPILSVIIPCYNQGHFLPEALIAVSDQKDIEVIIVNDGSTDEETIALFKKLDRSKYVVIEQENKGVSAARNIAIQNAKADYILALDADNIVFSEYYRKAILVLDENPDVGVVYSNQLIFGKRTESMYIGAFDLHRLLHGNFIDNCAIFRKKAWEVAGGYDVTMQGYEDWELWISIAKNGWKFHHIDEYLFKYRVRDNSLLTQCDLPENRRKLMNYIYKKHEELYQLNQFDITEKINSRILSLTNQIKDQTDQIKNQTDLMEQILIFKRN